MPGSIVLDEVELKDGGGGLPPAPPGAGGDPLRPRQPQREIPQSIYLTAIALALGTILMFFMALVSAFIVRKGLGGDWQPIELPRILWLTTAVLLASSFTIERARHWLKLGSSLGFTRWWSLTTVLGMAFLLGQLQAWRELRAAGVYLATNPSSSFFYLLTAAHGLHVLGGILVLLYVAVRGVQPRPGRHIQPGTAAEVAAVYWHFMDALWVFLFLLLHFGR